MSTRTVGFDRPDGGGIKYWCCAAEFGEHEPTCPNYAADEIDRKMARQMARWLERAILEIQNAIIDEVARHNERMAAENARHREAIADFERELQGYNAENHQQEEV